MLDIRKRLVDALGFDEADLPFAGELIEIRDDETRLGRGGRTPPSTIRPVASGRRKELPRRCSLG